MKTFRCRYCGAPVFSVVTGTKINDDGTVSPRRTLFNPTPVPTATCKVRAVVPSRARGWVDIADAHQPPDECAPMHRCPQYLDTVTMDELEQQLVRDDVQAFMDTRPMSPTPTPGGRRHASRRPA